MRQYIKPCDVTSVEAVLLDCCSSDYFQGTDAEETLCVPIYRGMTYRNLYDDLVREFHNSDGYFSNVCGSGTLVEESIIHLIAGSLTDIMDNPIDFVEDIINDSDDDDEGLSSVFIYVGLFAESDIN